MYRACLVIPIEHAHLTCGGWEGVGCLYMYQQQTSQINLNLHRSTVHNVIKIYLPKDADRRTLFGQNMAYKIENSAF